MRELDYAQVQDEFDTLLDAVAKGERVRILRNGTAIARLVPCEPEEGDVSSEMPGET